MRKSVLLVAGLLLMSTAVPALAEMNAVHKDECMLASRNCSDQVDDIQTRIHRLSREIAKGTSVYTPQELRRLEQKLADVQGLLVDLEKH